MIYSQEAQAYLENLLQEYKSTKRQQKKELSTLPLGQLTTRTVGKQINYVQTISADKSGSKRKRIGITTNKDAIAGLARKKYLQISLARLEKNIPLLERFIKQHQSLDPRDILNSMPTAYRGLPNSMFFPKQPKSSWEHEDFEQSTYKPEERRHITASGLAVRSKSEAIIADRLDFHKVSFRYEMMLHIENHSFSPDFVISTEKKIFYWEHCGLVNNKKYMQDHKWKLSVYEKAGIVPWDNLIVTYDDQYGNLDVRMIDSEIRNKLL